MNTVACYSEGSTSETETPIASLQRSEQPTQDEIDTSSSEHRRASTASCLPQDVLIAIFSHLHDLPPWEASAVCRWWRGAALSCTRLWSNITFEVLRFTKEKENSAKDGPGLLLDPSFRKYQLDAYRISLQLERLGSHPRTLHLNVIPPGRNPPIVDDQVKELMYRLISTFHLCSEITILKSGSYSATNLQGPISFPFLRHLHLHGRSWTWTRHCFQNTPALKSLYLEQVALLKQSELQFRWEGLVDLKLASFSLDVRVLLAVLVLPHRLASLTLWGGEIATQDVPSIRNANSLPVVVLPNLSFFAIAFDDRALVCTRRLMQQLRTPKLTTLHVKFVRNSALHITCSFLESSDCIHGLKHLTIDTPMRVRSWDPLIRLLPQLDALQALHIGPTLESDLTVPKEVSPTIPSIDSLLEALVWPPIAFTDLPGESSSSTFPNDIHTGPCPSLQFLQLEHMPMSTDLLRFMVLSRIPTTAQSPLTCTNDDRPSPLAIEDWCYLKCIVLRTGESLLWDTSPHPLSLEERLEWLRELDREGRVQFKEYRYSPDIGSWQLGDAVWWED